MMGARLRRLIDQIAGLALGLSGVTRISARCSASRREPPPERL
ncbi:hypothetical protein [Mycetohabitans endofungorum]